jgi:hypothetical protein
MRENGTQITLQGSDDLSHEDTVVLTKGKEEELSSRLSDLMDYVENATDDLDDEPQTILSELIVAISYIERSGNAYLAGAAEIAARALYARPQKLKLARELVKKIKRRVFLYRMLGSSPSTAVAFGLGLFFYLLAPLSLLLVNHVRSIDFEALLGTSWGVLVLVSLAGALGSIVSVLIRAQNHAPEPKVWGPIPYVFTGLFKPIVGMAFAIFVFAIFNSGIIIVPGADDSPKENFFFLAVAFVAGFSERFAKDIANSTEERYVGQSQNEQPMRAMR